MISEVDISRSEQEMNGKLYSRQNTVVWMVGLSLCTVQRSSYLHEDYESGIEAVHCKVCYSLFWSILIFNKSMEEHIEQLRAVLNRLRWRLFINLDNSELCKKQLIYLRNVISANGSSIDSEEMTAIPEWPTPGNITEVRRFHGFVNFYKKSLETSDTLVNHWQIVPEGKCSHGPKQLNKVSNWWKRK